MSSAYESIKSLSFAQSMGYSALSEMEFQRMVSLERRRASRSQKSSLLMLLEMGEGAGKNGRKNSLQKILSLMRKITRETDITGWYKDNSIVGVMFTEITFDDQSSVPPAMMSRLQEILKNELTLDEFRQLNVKLHFLSDAKDDVSVMPKAYTPVYAHISNAVAEPSF